MCASPLQLSKLLERIGGNLDAVADWASTLSLGEQQRLAFARVLLAKVRFWLEAAGGSAAAGGGCLCTFTGRAAAPGICACAAGQGEVLLVLLFTERLVGLDGHPRLCSRTSPSAPQTPACLNSFVLTPLLLAMQPNLVLMDESTSALDTRNERLLYQALRDAGAHGFSCVRLCVVCQPV